MPTYIAVDLGATSGRVANVAIGRDSIQVEVVHRFPVAVAAGGTWPFAALLSQVRHGITLARASAVDVRSVAVDTWGVDYGLLDARGHLVGPVHAYRSPRTDGVMERVLARVGGDHFYAITGIQNMAFNTLFQLVAARDTTDYQEAAGLLMVPDLINHALCGSRTNDASTTQLLDAVTRTWSDELVNRCGLRRDVLPSLHEPGSRLGTTADGLVVIAAASHDTASAVAGTPLRANRPGIYISCGTWALVGCELTQPVTSAAARAANVTNELGVDGTVRLLKNVPGLWLLEECRRTWAAQGQPTDIAQLIAGAARLPAGRGTFEPDDPSLVAPTDMPGAIAALCNPVPTTPVAIARAILDSLALAFGRTVALIERISGVTAEVIHLVGGGANNHLLAQLTADACQRPVLAGPTEATVLGNCRTSPPAAPSSNVRIPHWCSTRACPAARHRDFIGAEAIEER
jgi:rhamnulokinase